MFLQTKKGAERARLLTIVTEILLFRVCTHLIFEFIVLKLIFRDYE